MHKPFDNEKENKKFEKLFNNYILKDINTMILSTDTDIMKYLEIIVSALLLEINKNFPEPNYSIYMTYRIKSQKSNIEKLSDYICRLKENDTSISIKDISDLIGLRIIIEKIPHNISINKTNPEYETLQKLSNERKENIKISEQYHELEANMDNNNCTCFDYYSNSKELLQNIINMFNSETLYSKNYAIILKNNYNKLINECEKKIKILTALGDYSSKIDIDNIKEDKNPLKIDFKELLKDFDSRIDSKLGLKLYSNALPDIIKNSSILQKLGVSMSNDPSRIKHKREKSGYVSDFYGLDFEGIPIKTELQIMYTNEHQESITGYSAHSNMPGKEANFMEIPPEYARRNISLLENIGNSTFISNDELSLLNKITNIKDISTVNIELLKSITSRSNVVLNNNTPIGIKIDSDYLQDLKSLCTLSEKEHNNLKRVLCKEGCKIYDSWAKNISAHHATARLDKDSSAKNRVKIHYDDPYECLAHTIREQIENHTPKSIDAEYYLERIYENQSKWLKTSGLMSTESSIIDFEITEYAKTSLPELLKKVSNDLKIEENDIEK